MFFCVNFNEKNFNFFLSFFIRKIFFERIKEKKARLALHQRHRSSKTYRVIKSKHPGLKRLNIEILSYSGPGNQFFSTIHTTPFCLAKSHFFRFSRPHKVFSYRGPTEKHFMGSGKSKKSTFCQTKPHGLKCPEKLSGGSKTT